MSAFTLWAFTRWRLPRLRLRTCNCSLLLIYLPRKDEWLSWPSWLTYSRRFTHISGHPSAAGRAQDRESSLVKDRRSTTAPCNHLENTVCQCCDVCWAVVLYMWDHTQLSCSKLYVNFMSLVVVMMNYWNIEWLLSLGHGGIWMLCLLLQSSVASSRCLCRGRSTVG